MFRFLLYAFVLLLALAPGARAGDITLVLSDTDGPYAEFSETLAGALDGSPWKIVASGKFDAAGLLKAHSDLIVTAGSDALRQTLRRDEGKPIIATLLPRQTYESIRGEFATRHGPLTVIYLDQPAARQAAFLRQLLPGRKRIGMLVSQDTRRLYESFRHAFNAAGLTIDKQESDTDSTLLPALGTLLPRVNALLATPDPTIYNRDNIKAILITSYRYQKPLVAFSPAFVKAGALAALYSTPNQIARQTAALILAPDLPPPGELPPSQFAITINFNVADALGLSIPDEASIRRAMLSEQESR